MDPISALPFLAFGVALSLFTFTVTRYVFALRESNRTSQLLIEAQNLELKMLRARASGSGAIFSSSTPTFTMSGSTFIGGSIGFAPPKNPDACEHCGSHHAGVTDAITYHASSAQMYADNGDGLKALDEQRIVDALTLIAPQRPEAAKGWAKVKGLSAFPKP